jgi:hypothetical protein
MLETIKKQILEIYSICRDLSVERILNDQEDVFFPHMERLNRLAAVEVEDHEVDALIADKDLQVPIQKIAELKRIHGLRMETHRAQAIIASHSPWEILRRFVYYPNYIQLADMEFDGAKLKPGDRVIFLGSGPLPLSLITLASGHDIQGIGIEKETVSAELSRKVIACLGLSGQIEIILGDHYAMPLSHEHSLIIVGADAIPKREIFAHLAGALPTGMKISYRIYEKGLRRLFDVDAVGHLPANLKEYKRIRPTPPVNNTSVFAVEIDLSPSPCPSPHRGEGTFG